MQPFFEVSLKGIDRDTVLCHRVAVADGDAVQAGDLVVVLEAMKMEQPLTAHRAGTVKNLSARVGATVTSGSTLCEIVD